MNINKKYPNIKIHCGIRPYEIPRCSRFDGTHPAHFMQELQQQLSRGIVSMYADFGWTNNPYLVDCFAAENVIVHFPDGEPMKLSEFPDWPRWKAEMSAGEFWSTQGIERPKHKETQ